MPYILKSVHIGGNTLLPYVWDLYTINSMIIPVRSLCCISIQQPLNITSSSLGYISLNLHSSRDMDKMLSVRGGRRENENSI